MVRTIGTGCAVYLGGHLVLRTYIELTQPRMMSLLIGITVGLTTLYLQVRKIKKLTMDIILVFVAVGMHYMSDYMSKKPECKCPNYCEVDHEHLSIKKEVPS